MTRTMPPCPACGRQIVARNPAIQKVGGKARRRHKCPHGRWCISGTRHAVQGWNPGGPMHRRHCIDCATPNREGA